MLKRLLMLSLLLIGASAAHAQDAECTIDLGDAFAALANAQAALSGDDANAALARVTEAREALQVIEATCSGEAAPTRGYTAPNGAFTLRYPGTWRIGGFTPGQNGGLVVMGSSRQAATALQSDAPVFAPGDQSIQVTVAVPTTAGLDTGLPGVVNDFLGVITQRYQQEGEIEFTELNGREVARVGFSSEGFDALLMAVGLDDQDLRFAIVIGVAAPGELGELTPLVESVLLSIE